MSYSSAFMSDFIRVIVTRRPQSGMGVTRGWGSDLAGDGGQILRLNFKGKI